MSPLTTPKSVRLLRPLGLLVSVFAATSLACAGLGNPTLVPSPTITAGVPATQTVAPAEATPTELGPVATTAPATATEAPTAESATATPDVSTITETIYIASPGLGSRLTSPLHVEGFAGPTFEQHLVIQITDANGAVLAIQPTIIQADAGSAGPFSADVAFTTPTDQPGRISVFDTSARDGGLLHLASVEVDLVTSGASVVELAAEHPEVHIILEPAPAAVVSGGTLHVAGFSEYVFEGTLNIWLCGEGGSSTVTDVICGTADNVLMNGFTTMSAPDIGLPGPFALDLPYTIAGTVRARVAVYSTSARDGGIIHLTTVPVTLNP